MKELAEKIKLLAGIVKDQNKIIEEQARDIKILQQIQEVHTKFIKSLGKI